MQGRTAAEVSREIGINQSTFGDLLNLKISPFRKRESSDIGEDGYTKAARKIAYHYKMLAEDLFPRSLYGLNLPDIFEREYDSERVSIQIASGIPSMLPSPQEESENSELRRTVKGVLGTLTPRERQVIEMHYGLHGREYTLDQIGNRLGIQRQTVWMIECKALRRLRHPTRSRVLMKHIESVL